MAVKEKNWAWSETLKLSTFWVLVGGFVSFCMYKQTGIWWVAVAIFVGAPIIAGLIILFTLWTVE